MDDIVEIGWSALKHGLSEEDVLHAWRHAFAELRDSREGSVHLAVGPDQGGRLVEVIAERRADGSWYLFHAMTPPTRRVLRFLGLEVRR